MQLLIRSDGTITCLYSETIDLKQFGELALRRASHVEPGPTGDWWIDLAPVGGPLLGPYGQRSDALAAETRWLEMRLLHVSPS